MYPHLAADKNICPEFAQELVDCIWVKLNDVNKTRDESAHRHLPDTQYSRT